MTLHAETKKLVGVEMMLTTYIKMSNGTATRLNINAPGNCFSIVVEENLISLLFSYLTITKTKLGPIYNCCGEDLIVKAFHGSPNFDLGNFQTLVDQMAAPKGLERVLKRNYVIYRYSQNGSSCLITDCYVHRIWELLSLNGKYPVSVQSKNNKWLALRPQGYRLWQTTTNSAREFVSSMILAIYQAPNYDSATASRLVQAIETQWNTIKDKYQPKQLVLKPVQPGQPVQPVQPGQPGQPGKPVQPLAPKATFKGIHLTPKHTANAVLPMHILNTSNAPQAQAGT